jgi:hypothetical protein
LLVVFGCPGERDKGKRPMMGRIASEYCDLVVLTADNPAGECVVHIIDDIRAGVRENVCACLTGKKRFSMPSPGPGREIFSCWRGKAMKPTSSWAKGQGPLLRPPGGKTSPGKSRGRPTLHSRHPVLQGFKDLFPRHMGALMINLLQSMRAPGSIPWQPAISMTSPACKGASPRPKPRAVPQK